VSVRPVSLVDDGLLWLINRVVFHPRGYSLGYDPETKDFVLIGNGSEIYQFGDELVEQFHLDKIRRLMP
jgi:hypothetical protein